MEHDEQGRILVLNDHPWQERDEYEFLRRYLQWRYHSVPLAFSPDSPFLCTCSSSLGRDFL